MENERTIQDIERELKLYELKRAEKETKKNSLLSPTTVTLTVAIISLLSSLVVHFVQKGNQLELERQKFESELIIAAVKSSDKNTCRDNLNFLIEVGLIQQTSLKLHKVLADTSVPIFQLKSYSDINPGYVLEGAIVIPKDLKYENLKLFIWPHSTNLKETYKLRQQIATSNEGKFKIQNLEEIGYVIDIMYEEKLLKRLMYFPRVGEYHDFKIFDISQAEKP